jgi:hypothetical protein
MANNINSLNTCLNYNTYYNYNPFFDYDTYINSIKLNGYEIENINHEDLKDNNKFIIIKIYDNNVYKSVKITLNWFIKFNNIYDKEFDALLDFKNNKCGFCLGNNINNINNIHHTLFCPLHKCVVCDNYGHTIFNCPENKCDCHWSPEYDNHCEHDTIDDDSNNDDTNNDDTNNDDTNNDDSNNNSK